MTITDDRSSTPTPAATPPSYVRRHPIIAAFGVLSGLSLFSALWPLSAVVVGVAVAGHATGLDRAALHLVERLAERVSSSARLRAHPGPAPAPPTRQHRSPPHPPRQHLDARRPHPPHPRRFGAALTRPRTRPPPPRRTRGASARPSRARAGFTSTRPDAPAGDAGPSCGASCR